ncbi:MAG: alanine racemase [Candidatus Aadella gelida]|nr:alanine racemase [Candidatus Aadella gelida]
MSTTNYRPTWAEIDLNAIRYNLSSIKRVVGKNTGIMAVVKANAYGHGIEEISDVIIKEGVEYLGVATTDEALKLRKRGIKEPILVLGSVLEEEAKVAVDNNITLTLCDAELFEILKKVSAKKKSMPKVHIKVDTGMGRIGVWHEEAIDFIEDVHNCGKIEIEGVYTHFSSAARDKLFTQMQVQAFDKVIEDLKRNGVDPKYQHAANSIAAIDWKNSRLNLIRTGILIYGVYPKKNFRRKFELKPVMSLKTKVVYLKDAPPGRSISYGRTYITQKKTKIATIPIGYADGYGRILSNKAEALIRGQHVRVVGMVTMDQTLLDVGTVKDVKVGDEVVLIGRQSDSDIPIEKIAKLAGTIPYEILSAVTDRVPRVYIN